METTPVVVKVLKEHPAVADFLAAVTAAADSARLQLGWFPGSVYEEYSKKGNLFVATVVTGNQHLYAGHVLFDVRHPKAKVMQVFASPQYRRLGIASKLIGELKEHLTGLQCVSIDARVAEDMVPAQKFWERQGFYAHSVRPGGSTRNRTIILRTHELSTPQLFGSSGIDGTNPLGLRFSPSLTERPTYLFDLNVLFDLGPRRNRREEVVNLFKAERARLCHLAVSSEMREELIRNSSAGKTDPLKDFVAIFPTYSYPNEDKWKEVFDDVAAIVFPEKLSREQLSRNDRSDVRHLVTVIRHGLRGFITSDEAVLDSASALQRRFGIDVVSPASFSLPEELDDSVAHTSEDGQVLTCEVVSSLDESSISDFLLPLGVTPSQLQTEWAVVAPGNAALRRHIVRDLASRKVLGYSTWSAPIATGPLSAHVAIAVDAPIASDVAHLILGKLIDETKSSEVTLVLLCFPARQNVLREVALAMGFSGGREAPSQLQKIVLNAVVTPANWAHYRDTLAVVGGVRLPRVAPELRSVEQHLEIYTADSNRRHIPLLRLESELSPALFCLPGRSGIIVPIRRKYAEPLLQHLNQASLLPQARAQLYQQRHYLCHPKALPLFSPGALAFFYESQRDNGLSAIVAVARIVRAYHQAVDAMSGDDLTASVLEAAELDELGKTTVRTVAVFDNVTVLHTPIPRQALQEFGCGKPVQLLNTQRISAEQVQSILQQAKI